MRTVTMTPRAAMRELRALLVLARREPQGDRLREVMDDMEKVIDAAFVLREPRVSHDMAAE